MALADHAPAPWQLGSVSHLPLDGGGWLLARVTDDGSGPGANPPRGLGQAGMRDRAAALNGHYKPPRREADRIRSGMWCGTYSPITSGFSELPSSSTRSTSMVLMSITQCRPLTGWA